MKENKTIILVDLSLYSLEAIYGAAYVFLDKSYIFLEKGSDTKIKIILKDKEKPSKNLKDEFLNELLNFSLREKISKNNKKIREYIVSKALSSALGGPTYPVKKPLEQILKQKDGPLWKQDSFGVAIPWAEKKQEGERKGVCEENVMNFPIPWDKKNTALNHKKEEIKRDSEINPLGITIPWEIKYPKKNSGYKKVKRTNSSKNK